jgi:hypothetical protein
MAKVSNTTPLLKDEAAKLGPTASEQNYRGHRNMAMRTAFMCAVISMLVMWPPLVAQIPKSWANYIALVPSGTLLMVVFTVYGDTGSTVQLFYQGLIGTFWACAWTHVMFAIMPNGCGALKTAPLVCLSDEYYAPVVHISHILLVFVSMWINISKNVRMFILSYQVYFAADFMTTGNVAESGGYNTDWGIAWQSYTVTTLVTAFVGVAAAILVPILPFPVLAKKSALSSAQDTVTQLCDCMDHLVTYFNQDKASVIIVTREVEINDVSSSISGMQGAIDAMWWETFDIGASGKVRKLLTKHVDMLGKLCDTMLAMQVCLRKEDFGDTHKQCMRSIKLEADDLCKNTREVLVSATVSASDGDISEDEKATLKAGVEATAEAIVKLSVKFNITRKKIAQQITTQPGVPWQNQVILPDLQSESFFVYSLCSYARQVSQYAQLMTEKEVKKKNVFIEMWHAWKQVWDWETLQNRLQPHTVTIRGTIEILLCYYVGMYCMGSPSAAAAGTVALLIADSPGSALTKNMGRIQAVVIGALVPHILTQLLGATCGGFPYYRSMAKIVVFFLYEVLACYIYYSSKQFGYIGCLVAAFSCGVLCYPCAAPVDAKTTAENENTAEIAAFAKMSATILGVIIMTVVDLCLASERASAGANRTFLESFLKLDSWFQGIFLPRGHSGIIEADELAKLKCRADVASDHHAAKHCVKKFEGQSLASDVSENLAKAMNLGGEADQEPRYYRAPFKSEFFSAVVKCACELRHNLAVIEDVYCGVSKEDAHKYTLFSFLRDGGAGNDAGKKAWDDVRLDVINTMGNAFEMMQSVLENETGKPSTKIKEKMAELEGADKIDAMEDLVRQINSGDVKYPDDPAVLSMDCDTICRMNVVLMLLESSIEHVSGMLKECLKQV